MNFELCIEESIEESDIIAPLCGLFGIIFAEKISECQKLFNVLQ